MEICILILVRDMGTTNPQTNRNRRFSKRICRISVALLGAILANIFAGTNQCGGTSKLLCGQKTQGVSHNDRRSGRLFRVCQFAVENRKCRQTKICLCLTATGGEPYQVNNAAFQRLIIYDRVDVHQQECNLERSPAAVCIALPGIIHPI